MKHVNPLYSKIKLRLDRLNPAYILLILLIPLFFINIHGYTDWGDDFALYIHQAKKMAEGYSPQDTHLIYNEDNPVMISNVSIGFSILLLPVYLIFGLNFTAFSIYMTLLLVLTGLVLLFYFRRYMPDWIALLSVLLVVYHRFTLDFKQFVLSDIPFVGFLFILIYLYEKYGIYKLKYALLLGFLGGYLINIRSIGLVFPLAIMLSVAPSLLAIIMKKSAHVNFKEKILFPVITGALSLLVFYIIHKIAFPKPTEGGYLNYFLQHDLGNVIFKNIRNYLSWFKWFFTFKKITYSIQLLFFYLFSIMMIGGMIIRIKKAIQFADLIFFLLLSIIIIYPANPGFRYLLPIIPFTFIYFYSGVYWISRRLNTKWLKLQYFIPILFLALYYPGIIWHIETKDFPSGTEKESALETFKYIRYHLHDDAVIVFIKPRALSLYTEKYALANNSKERNPFRLDYLYKKYGVDYLLQNISEIPDSALMVYLNAFPNRCKLIYSNKDFRLYRLIPDNQY